MVHITFRLLYGQPMKRFGILVSLLILVFLFVGSYALLREPTAALGASVDAVDAATFLPTTAGRHFYLTKSSYASNVAKSACASGYRMASLWEILDPSNLTYDYNHPQAYTKVDSGLGAPSSWYGRVRTGYDSNGSSTTGTGNCLNWTTAASTNYGVFVRLSRTWETAPGDIGPWDATKFTCNVTGPVWCVAEISVLFLPQVRK